MFPLCIEAVGRKKLGESSKGRDCVAFISLLHNTLCECLKHQVKTYLELLMLLPPAIANCRNH